VPILLSFYMSWCGLVVAWYSAAVWPDKKELDPNITFFFKDSFLNL